MDWNVIQAFFETEHGQKLIKQALDKDQYWDKSKMGPTQDEVKVAHPQGGTDTTVVVPGKGGKDNYDVKSTDVKADGHVETITEVHNAVEEVALKEPKGVQGAAEKPAVKTAKMALLEKLADVASKLDEKGLTEEADQIDQIINEETNQ